METLGDRLKSLRQKAGMTQQQVAFAIGKSKGNVSGYENGSFEPSANTIIKLSECFNISTDYLLLGEDECASTNNPLTEGEEEIMNLVHPLAERDKIRVAGVIENYLATRHRKLPDGDYIGEVFTTSTIRPTRK